MRTRPGEISDCVANICVGVVDNVLLGRNIGVGVGHGANLAGANRANREFVILTSLDVFSTNKDFLIGKGIPQVAL